MGAVDKEAVDIHACSGYKDDQTDNGYPHEDVVSVEVEHGGEN